MIRLLDITLSLLGLICLLPIMVIIYIFGLIDTGSPLFVQKRLGKNQHPFHLIKFRTMQIGSSQVGTHLADSNQITTFGNFLRKTKLDELPQLWNVLIGDMSIVGPRPGLPNQTKLRDQREKRGVFLSVPGITGLAQINDVDMSTPRKLSKYDQLMLKRLNIKLYLNIIISTAIGKGSGDRIHHKINQST